MQQKLEICCVEHQAGGSGADDMDIGFGEQKVKYVGLLLNQKGFLINAKEIFDKNTRVLF